MRLVSFNDGGALMHSVHDSFAGLLSLTLRGKTAIAALGPIYTADPAAGLLLPFIRSAVETGWQVDPDTLAPKEVLERARKLRREQTALNVTLLFDQSEGFKELIEWTRAGLVLEVCRANGVNYAGRGQIRVPWRLNGTVTGRFGTEPVRGDGWTFNPLSLGPRDRVAITPRSPDRRIAVMDFRAMDLCSMVSLVPGLAAKYDQPEPVAVAWDGVPVPGPKNRIADLHAITVKHLFGHDYSLHDYPKIRAHVKEQIFVHAYGGNSDLRRDFQEKLPELDWLRQKPHGEGARLVQAQSARAFRAALSEALPLLLQPEVMPLFTVHDELALEYSETHSLELAKVAMALERGASQRIGVPYRVGVSTGLSYEEAKHKP